MEQMRAFMELSSSIIVLVLIANVAFSFHFLYLLAVSLAALTSRRKPVTEGVARSRFKIVIPAHDEELDITDTVRSCQAQDYPKDFFELIVIADNCLDSTAALASRAGAIVVERHDDLNRSKGHALRFLFDRLEKSGEMDRTDALVIIDSDTVVDAAYSGDSRDVSRRGTTGFKPTTRSPTTMHPGEPGSWRIRSASSTESGSSVRTHWDSVPASVEMGCACPSAGSAGAPGRLMDSSKTWNTRGSFACRVR